MYSDDELLMLSGIQHFAFCERQWAMIHIEQQWAENLLTVEGHHMHERVDDPFINEVYYKKLLWRSLPVISYKLGVSGKADIIELIQVDSDILASTIKLPGNDNRYMMVPVEYKRGRPKRGPYDELQLCAQAICLEEMFNIHVPSGWLFYGEMRRRVEVDFTNPMRELVESQVKRMHELFSAFRTPPPEVRPCCKSCSLFDLCMPEQLSREDGKVNAYLYRALENY